MGVIATLAKLKNTIIFIVFILFSSEIFAGGVDIFNIRKGMTKAEVTQRIGYPNKIIQNDTINKKTVYLYIPYRKRNRVTELQFNTNGKLVKILQYRSRKIMK